MELKNYQLKAVEEICDIIYRKINSQEKYLISFVAPTGSGKTIMMAEVINTLYNELALEDYCILWVSPSKGGLVDQSYNKIKKSVNKGIRCVKITDEVRTGRSEVKSSEVMFIGWSEINGKDKDGQFKKIVMRDGDYKSLKTILSNTREKNRKIILFLDESHIGQNTVQTGELIDMIAPTIQVNITATPREDSRINHKVQIKAEDVIKEGMIKKHICLNKSKDYDGEEDYSIKGLINQAEHTRLKILESYKRLGVRINPLVLVQISNDEKGEEQKEILEKIFIDMKKTDDEVKYYSKDNNTVKDNTDSTQYLLFKQAIDTGWDCPRAHILVKLRDKSKPQFEIQVLGRILRMPELKHYNDYYLDNAFAFYDESKFELNEANPFNNELKHSTTLKEDIENISLYGYKRKSDKKAYESVQNIMLSSIENSFKSIFDELKINPDKINTMIETRISNISKLGVVKILEREHYVDNANKKAVIKLSSIEARYRFNVAIEDVFNDRSLRDIFSETFTSYFCDKFSERKDAMELCYYYVATNVNMFKDKIAAIYAESMDSIKEMATKNEDVDAYEFSLPFTLYHSEKCIKEDMSRYPNAFAKYAYNDIYMSPINKDSNTGFSGPELAMVRFIDENHSKIKWWYKNKDNGNNVFTVGVYDSDKGKREFNPDFLIMDYNDVLWILETKGGKDNDIDKYTPEKFSVLYNYVNRKPIISGIREIKGYIARPIKGAYGSLEVATGSEFDENHHWKPFYQIFTENN